MDSSLYTNLKRQSIVHDNYIGNANINGQQQSHLSQLNNQSHCTDSTSNFLNLTTSTSPSQATTPNNDESSMIGAYQSNYTFLTADTTAGSTLESDYIINSNSITTSNQPMSNLLSSSSATGSHHQRRGSLQLWQFLVALLDEPASRLIIITIFFFFLIFFLFLSFFYLNYFLY